MRRCFLVLLLVLAAGALPAGCQARKAPPGIEVVTHPDGPLYVGDRVSLEVIVPEDLQTDQVSLEAAFRGTSLGSAAFGPYGIGGRRQATLWWIWDTRDLAPGPHRLTLTLHPGLESWEQVVWLWPAALVPAPEPEAHWATAESPCCTYSYITGTDAERDLVELTRTAQDQSDQVRQQLGTGLAQTVAVVFVPRVIGHGGFTWTAVYVSYLDSSYIGNEMGILFHHEFVHFYDAALGGTYRPAMLQEGLAVYLSGGHFKPEPLGPRAAALIKLGWFLPLETLANDFYAQQHDIGYLEAAALVSYLVDTYGWEEFNTFYRSIPLPDSRTDAQVLDQALADHFELSLARLEHDLRQSLVTLPADPEAAADLEATVDFFDTVRAYQSALDPSAYFLTAWLPDGMQLAERGLVADFLRRPRALENRLLEALLISSHQELLAGGTAQAGRILDWTRMLLELASPAD